MSGTRGAHAARSGSPSSRDGTWRDVAPAQRALRPDPGDARQPRVGAAGVGGPTHLPLVDPRYPTDAARSRDPDPVVSARRVGGGPRLPRGAGPRSARAAGGPARRSRRAAGRRSSPRPGNDLGPRRRRDVDRLAHLGVGQREAQRSHGRPGLVILGGAHGGRRGIAIVGDVGGRAACSSSRTRSSTRRSISAVSGSGATTVTLGGGDGRRAASTACTRAGMAISALMTPAERPREPPRAVEHGVRRRGRDRRECGVAALLGLADSRTQLDGQSGEVVGGGLRRLNGRLDDAHRPPVHALCRTLTEAAELPRVRATSVTLPHP